MSAQIIEEHGATPARLGGPQSSRPDVAARMFDAIYQSVPYNADYAFRAAMAHAMSNASPDKVRAMLDIAIATEPTNVSYRLTRAGYELRQPQPDQGAVRADFDAAVRLDPQNIHARLEYAKALQQGGALVIGTGAI